MLWQAGSTPPIGRWSVPTQRPIVALGADASTLVVGTATGVQIAHLDEPDNSLVSLPGVADEVTAMAADLSNHLGDC